MKTLEPALAVRALQPVVEALEALGHPAALILEQAGVSRSLLQDADGRVPHSAMMKFWNRALVLTGDEHLGIHLAEAAPMQSFEVHAYAMLSSSTLREALRRACRYQRLIHEATDLVFEEGAHEGVLRHALPGGRPVPRHPAEFLATLWVRIGRLVTGTPWAPRLVCFAHEQPNAAGEHARVFQAPVQFSGGFTAMHFPNEILDTSNPHADAHLARLLDRYAEGLLKHIVSRHSPAARLRAWLVEVFSSGSPTAASAARALHMSVRTLHRHLREEGTSFRELLDQLRQEQAVALLSNPRYSIAEVGFLLGFGEISSFSRAFKRWSGRSPAEYRAGRFALSVHGTQDKS